MNKRQWITAGVALAGLAGALAWAFAPRPVQVEAASVTVGPFETAVEDDGKTRLRDLYLVSAPLAGLVGRITLREGDQVAAGAVVASMRAARAPLRDERTRREQLAQLGSAQAQVRAAAAARERAAIARRRADQDAQRSARLARERFVSPSVLERDQAAALAAAREHDAAVALHQVALHGLEQARAALSVGGQDGPQAGAPQALRGPDASMAAPRSGADADKAAPLPGADAGTAAPLRAPQDGTTVALRAPVAGRVLRVLQASEAVVPLGAPLIELGDPAQLEVVAELLTADALQARPGSAVRIDRWGGAPLAGRVRRIEPAAFTKISALGVEEQRVKVIIDLVAPPADFGALGVGYRVNVRVVTARQEKVLKVPVSALFPLPQTGAASEAAMAVYVVDNGRARLKPVQLGGRNDVEAWVQAGLAAGAQVIVYPAPQIRDGVAVAVRKVARQP